MACHKCQDIPVMGVRYGQLRYTQGRIVRVTYAIPSSPTEIERTVVTVLCVLEKNSTRPTRNKNTEV